MAVTPTFSGTHVSYPSFRIAKSGDKGGADTYDEQVSVTWAVTGGTAPTGEGVLNGSLSVTGAQDILLAHATDPLQACGDSTYSEGFAPAGKKLKYLRIRNTHATASLKVERGTNGLPVFDATGDSITIPAGGYVEWYFPAGTAALTTGSNDKLTLTPSTGTMTGEIIAVYGS